ncbi:hypothetical protein N7447_002568 [Penicillium robsamsonii]|uniref:uncharacterized protein n=1 Tax=Penicillium robsamsonii TaxID=1792511 RepID=UPI002546AF60|nr:uncharacterized protein N7447_002568 [Penicillium robsamsonii]KAJ5836542.1 hypothetical protein N7447_002568 [Penicillium robsamsonii]
MQNMSRRFGRMTTKSSADDSQIAVLLKDFDDADMLLGKIMESTKAWRDAWVSIATYQSRLVDEFDGLYGPIIGSSETPSNHKAVETDPIRLARTNRLRKEYDELRNDLIEELNAVDTRMSQPAAQAKESLAPMKKTIKKRNDKKTDFEISQGRVDSLMKRPKRTDRENVSLAKAEAELANTKEAYQAADHDLRQRLPTLIALIFSLTPYILDAQVEIQNRMLAHYYTVLHTYCVEEGFPSPPPAMEQVVQDWEFAFNPVQAEIENFGCLTQGKAMHRAAADQENKKRPSIGGRLSSTASSTSLHNSFRRGSQTPGSSSQTPCVPEYPPSPPLSTISHRSNAIPVGNTAGSKPLSTGGDYFDPPRLTFLPTPQPTPIPSGVVRSPAGPNIDCFQAKVLPMSVAAGKKRPPPPPPAASRPVFVTALYDFDGQGDGDLSFREGDRIRIVRKTQSTDDWWEGELRGQRGPFPANYVEREAPPAMNKAQRDALQRTRTIFLSEGLPHYEDLRTLAELWWVSVPLTIEDRLSSDEELMDVMADRCRAGDCKVTHYEAMHHQEALWLSLPVINCDKDLAEQGWVVGVIALAEHYQMEIAAGRLSIDRDYIFELRS